MSPAVLAAGLAAGSVAGSGCAPTCTDGIEDCFEVTQGQYLAFEPETTPDGGRPHLLIYFHGWSSSAQTYAKKKWLKNRASERGYLLVLPDGVDETWAHVGSPSRARDELAFMDEVITDIDARWDISEVRAVAGFSQGGSMAWDLACYRGQDYSAFIPASGAFWKPLPPECDSPVNLRHTHGTEDTVIPLEGRSLGGPEQGNVWEALQILRDVNGCEETPDSSETDGEVTCDIWSSCSSGQELRICLHGGKHRLPDGYLSQALDWVEGVSPTGD